MGGSKHVSENPVAGARVQVGPGTDVEFVLDNEQVVVGAVNSLRASIPPVEAIFGVSRQWNRWACTTTDLVALARESVALIAEYSSDEVPVEIIVHLGAKSRERYFDLNRFERELSSNEPPALGAQLSKVQAISMVFGPSGDRRLKVEFALSSRPTDPAVCHLNVEGADRAVAEGLAQGMSARISARRPRMPALPGPARMLIGGLAGVLYAIGFFTINWTFLPETFAGNMIFALIYLIGFIALIYGVTYAHRALLPPLRLTKPGEVTGLKTWRGRLIRLGGFLVTAATPFVLQKLFGS